MKALIIEDERMAREHLVKVITSDFSDIEIVGATSSIQDTLDWFKNTAVKPDIVFTDVELEDGKCFDIFNSISINAHIIITTAYDFYAIKAFEINSIDYILKPINTDALRRAVERVRKSQKPIDVEKLIGALNVVKEEKNYKERFLVQLNDHIVPVKTSDIAFFFAEDKDNHVVTRDGTIYIIDSSLNNTEADLNPNVFFKISRGCIIAKEAVDSVTKLFGGRLRISIKPELEKKMKSFKDYNPDFTVSRSRVDEFLIWLEK